MQAADVGLEDKAGTKLALQVTMSTKIMAGESAASEFFV